MWSSQQVPYFCLPYLPLTCSTRTSHLELLQSVKRGARVRTTPDALRSTYHDVQKY